MAYLGMERFMFPGHEQHASNFPGHLELSGGDVTVYFEEALTDARLEIKER
jgi:hypothetical protein